MTTDKYHIPATAPMWWDGGDRAITAREKATIEEHGPSCYTIPLLPAQAVDPADPWRGLYLPARMPAPSEYGDLTHPDIPRWPDDLEDALDKLVHAQGFDFHIVAGDFTEEAMEDGDELYWQELRAWNPEAPEGEWRLAWKGDTEDGPYAWFVRPMALRPEPVALAATGKQVGEVQGDARAALEAAMPYVETLHSIVGGEARASVWRCIERGRAALAATGTQQVGEEVEDDRFPNGFADAIAYADEMEEAAGGLYQDVMGYETDGSHTGTQMLELAKARAKELFKIARDELAARQPGAQVPVAVVVPGAPTSCKNCGGTDLEWFAHVRALNDVQQGRLNTHDVGCVFVLGCEECSETLHVVKADDIAALLNAAPPAQAVDMGQFNALAALANAIVHHRGESPMKNGVFAEAERLLALIDQSDAAPGVGNG